MAKRTKRTTHGGGQGPLVVPEGIDDDKVLSRARCC